MAVRLGRVNVDAMLRSLTAKQFFEWEAYARMEPFSEVRADYRAASIRAMIHNVNVEEKYQKDIDHFLLKWKDEATPKQSWQDKKAIAMAICAAWSVRGKDQ